MSHQKLQVSDIKLVGEGQQILQAMVEDSGSIEEFIKKHDLRYSVNTVKSNVGRQSPRSEKFRCAIVAAFKKPYSEDIYKSR